MTRGSGDQFFVLSTQGHTPLIRPSSQRAQPVHADAAKTYHQLVIVGPPGAGRKECEGIREPFCSAQLGIAPFAGCSEGYYICLDCCMI